MNAISDNENYTKLKGRKLSSDEISTYLPEKKSSLTEIIGVLAALGGVTANIDAGRADNNALDKAIWIDKSEWAGKSIWECFEDISWKGKLGYYLENGVITVMSRKSAEELWLSKTR